MQAIGNKQHRGPIKPQCHQFHEHGYCLAAEARRIIAGGEGEKPNVINLRHKQLWVRPERPKCYSPGRSEAETWGFIKSI